MINLNKEDFFLMGISAILMIIAIFVIQSFIIPLLFTMVLAYILNPLYRKVLRVVKNKALTSAIFIVIILLLIVVPITLISLNLIHEITQTDDTKIINSLGILSNEIKINYNVNINFQSQYNIFLDKLTLYLQSFLFKIPEFLFQIFLVLFFYYYFSKDYNSEINFLKNIFNYSKFSQFKLELEQLISGIVYGQILVRLIQAIILAIGFFLLNIQGALILGILTFFAAFIPIIGTSIIWFPFILMNVLNQNYLLAVLIIILGFFVSTIDNFLLPYLISGKTNIGPVITLISILGGLQFFGLYGIVLGPFFVGILLILLEKIFNKFKKGGSNINRYIWSKEERSKLNSLKSDIAKKNYINIINSRHESEMKKNYKVSSNIQF